MEILITRRVNGEQVDFHQETSVSVSKLLCSTTLKLV